MLIRSRGGKQVTRSRRACVMKVGFVDCVISSTMIVVKRILERAAHARQHCFHKVWDNLTTLTIPRRLV